MYVNLRTECYKRGFNEAVKVTVISVKQLLGHPANIVQYCFHCMYVCMYREINLTDNTFGTSCQVAHYIPAAISADHPHSQQSTDEK